MTFLTYSEKLNHREFCDKISKIINIHRVPSIAAGDRLQRASVNLQQSPSVTTYYYSQRVHKQVIFVVDTNHNVMMIACYIRPFSIRGATEWYIQHGARFDLQGAMKLSLCNTVNRLDLKIYELLKPAACSLYHAECCPQVELPI